MSPGQGAETGSLQNKENLIFSVHPLQFSDLSPPLPLSCKNSNSEIII